MNEAIYDVEGVLRAQIGADVQYNWREETVVLNLLSKLRQHLNKSRLSYSSNPYKVDFQIFHAFGTPERKFGDISVVIKRYFPSGEYIEGVGFMEAKIRHKTKLTYDSIRVGQLKKISSNAPHALLLLLDHKAIVFTDRRDFHRFHPRYSAILSTQSAVTQIRSALALSSKNESLHQISYPLSIQLIDRYFKGLDLEFKKQTIDIAKGYADQKGYPTYTVFITLYPYYSEIESDIEINGNVYREVE